MTDFLKTDFVRTGLDIYLGPYYADYWTTEIKHVVKGTTANVLLDSDGNLVQEPNNITDRIRNAFSIDGRTAKIIPMTIEGVKFLVLKFPTI